MSAKQTCTVRVIITAALMVGFVGAADVAQTVSLRGPATAAAETIKCPKCGNVNPAKTPDGKEVSQCQKCGYSLKKFAADKGPDKVDVSKYPAEMQTAYKTFSKRCSKCHTLARPLWTRFTADEWEKYVKRMRRKPGSGIKAEEAKTIYEFLVYDSKARAKEKDEFWAKVSPEERKREEEERKKREGG